MRIENMNGFVGYNVKKAAPKKGYERLKEDIEQEISLVECMLKRYEKVELDDATVKELSHTVQNYFYNVWKAYGYRKVRVGKNVVWTQCLY